MTVRKSPGLNRFAVECKEPGCGRTGPVEATVFWAWLSARRRGFTKDAAGRAYCPDHGVSG